MSIFDEVNARKAATARRAAIADSWNKTPGYDSSPVLLSPSGKFKDLIDEVLVVAKFDVPYLRWVAPDKTIRVTQFEKLDERKIELARMGGYAVEKPNSYAFEVVLTRDGKGEPGFTVVVFSDGKMCWMHSESQASEETIKFKGKYKVVRAAIIEYLGNQL